MATSVVGGRSVAPGAEGSGFFLGPTLFENVETAPFASDVGAARRFENELQVGMVGINIPVPVPMAYYYYYYYYYFGGWKNSSSATPMRTEPRLRTSSPEARPSPPAGRTWATVASTLACPEHLTGQPQRTQEKTMTSIVESGAGGADRHHRRCQPYPAA
ncbi:hypothetical protein [Arthrobacter alpinus]|uniref:hypothetical protein n=1 Tax=Arthrobacter alpinus TaxID=656366 RepID=UPI0021BD96F3|nr:hypothetical protein [Arthrobacter alpinus]